MKNIEKYKREFITITDMCKMADLYCDATGKKICHTADSCQECEKEVLKWLLEEYKQSVLDEAEKKYLSDVIRPLRKEVAYIRKSRMFGNYIVIAMKRNYLNNLLPNCDICLPQFSKDSNMYKGMETDRRYTVEELGL